MDSELYLVHHLTLCCDREVTVDHVHAQDVGVTVFGVLAGWGPRAVLVVDNRRSQSIQRHDMCGLPSTFSVFHCSRSSARFQREVDVTDEYIQVFPFPVAKVL